MDEYDAKMVAADIVLLLRQHWLALPNGLTDKALTSYRQNACGEGIREAINVIADVYGLDISNPDAVEIKSP